jgi:hypothetical protein
MAKQKLNEVALDYSLAIFSAVGMLLTGIAGNLGWYSEFVGLMMQMHEFFSLSVMGIFTGMVEAAIWGFFSGWIIAWIYNKF